MTALLLAVASVIAVLVACAWRNGIESCESWNASFPFIHIRRGWLLRPWNLFVRSGLCCGAGLVQLRRRHLIFIGWTNGEGSECGWKLWLAFVLVAGRASPLHLWLLDRGWMERPK